MAKGLGSRAMLCASSMAKVSRALWPMARINWRQGNPPPAPGSIRTRPESLPSRFSSPVSWVWNRTSPPRASTRRRRFCTTVSKAHRSPHEVWRQREFLPVRRTEPAAPGPSGSGGRGCRCSASRRRRFRRRPPQTGRCTGDLGGRSARRPQPDGGGRRRLAPAQDQGAGVRPPPGPGRQTYRPAQNPPQQAAFGGAGQDRGGCHSGRRGQGWPLRHPGEWPGFPEPETATSTV